MIPDENDDDLPFKLDHVGEWTDAHTRVIAQLLLDTADEELKERRRPVKPAAKKTRRIREFA